MNIINVSSIYTWLWVGCVFLCTQGSAIAQHIPTYKKFEHFADKHVFENDTTYVINFWATWCKPCINELPYFDSLYSLIKNIPVKIILVSLDFSKKDTHIKKFLQKHKLRPDVVLLADSNYNRWLSFVSDEWSGSIPATWLISGKKRQLVEHEFENTEELKQYVNSFISSL